MKISLEKAWLWLAKAVAAGVWIFVNAWLSDLGRGDRSAWHSQGKAW